MKKFFKVVCVSAFVMGASFVSYSGYAALAQKSQQEFEFGQVGKWDYPKIEGYITRQLKSEKQQGEHEDEIIFIHALDGYRDFDFTTLVKKIKPHKQRYKLALSAEIKTQEPKAEAALWMRVDGENRKVLAFDNMHERSIKGNSDWDHYSVILEVPPEAINISLGVWMSGPGKAWIKNMHFEEVDPQTAITGEYHSPQNLELE